MPTTITTHALETRPLCERIGTEIVADRALLLSGGYSEQIREILALRGVVLIRGLNLSDEEQAAFAETLGTVRSEYGQKMMKITLDRSQIANPAYADYFLATAFWHMDGTHDDVPPLASILTPRVLSPTGGETEFANTYASYDDLSDAEKERFEGLRIVHTKLASIVPALKNPTEEQLDALRGYGAKTHPLVWHHTSGRKSLAMSSSADHVEGMDPEESKALIGELQARMTQRQYVYQHKWQMGDLLIWDNTGTMHRVMPYDLDCGRRLHRVTLEGEESLAR